MLSLSALGYWDYMLCPTLIAKADTCRHSWHENMSNTSERNVLLSLAQGYNITILMFLSGHSNTNHLHRCFNSLIRWETIHTVNKNKLLYTHSQNTHVLKEKKYPLAYQYSENLGQEQMRKKDMEDFWIKRRVPVCLEMYRLKYWHYVDSNISHCFNRKYATSLAI